MITILEGICCTDNHDQRLINSLSRGRLTAVHNGCVLIFLMTEELFRKGIMGNRYKIYAADMVDQFTTKPEVISIFNNIFKESEIKNFFARIKI